MLGDLTSKYESGNKGYDAISSTPGDPGGASYGKYQLASKVGTLQAFLKFSKYYLDFAGIKPGTPSFANKWIAMCKISSFRDAQHAFIKVTHFDPVMKYWLGCGFTCSPMIDEAIWSMSVQHSLTGCQKIIDAAELDIPQSYEDADAIKYLYKCRDEYINNIKLPDNIKLSLHNRYKNEMKDILNINIED